MMAPAVAQQTDDETFVVSANRSNRTVAEMAQTTGYRKRRTGTADSGRQRAKDALAQLIHGLDVSSRSRTNYGMNVRGRPLVVLVDGVRLNSSRTDSRQLDSIDPLISTILK
ncbi:TonB-dependent receptor plug domain-containing protein [Escherichia coli]|nr:TonB-dependent receptor plug domain-containing protein [Escherichia coli]